MSHKKKSNDGADDQFRKAIYNEDHFDLSNIAEEDSLYFDEHKEEREIQRESMRIGWSNLTRWQKSILTEMSKGVSTELISRRLELTIAEIDKMALEAQKKIKAEYDRLKSRDAIE